jgi:hypothetical protein
MLDELEEWQLLLSHYCVTLAVKDSLDGPLSAGIDLSRPVVRPPLDAFVDVSSLQIADAGEADAAARRSRPTIALESIFDDGEEEDECSDGDGAAVMNDSMQDGATDVANVE